MKRIIEISNKDYFMMVYNEIQNKFPSFEENILLPDVKKTLIRQKINLKDLVIYPIEGYYYKTDGLKEYFKLISNIKYNEKIQSKLNLVVLSNLTKVITDEIWGLPFYEGGLLFPKMKDRLTLSLEKMLPCEISIDNVFNRFKQHDKNSTNLVEFAYHIDDKECLVLAAYSNALYREVAIISGNLSDFYIPEIEYKWNVDKEIELFGTELINKYNKIIQEHCDKNYYLLNTPHENNISSFDREVPKFAIACLAYLEEIGLYYHWILNDSMISEFYYPKVLTKEIYDDLFSS